MCGSNHCRDRFAVTGVEGLMGGRRARNGQAVRLRWTSSWRAVGRAKGTARQRRRRVDGRTCAMGSEKWTAMGGGGWCGVRWEVDGHGKGWRMNGCSRRLQAWILPRRGKCRWRGEQSRYGHQQVATSRRHHGLLRLEWIRSAGDETRDGRGSAETDGEAEGGSANERARRWAGGGLQLSSGRDGGWSSGRRRGRRGRSIGAEHGGHRASVLGAGYRTPVRVAERLTHG